MASAVCGMDEMKLWTSLRPRPALCLVGRAATAHVFLCLISSGWAKPEWAARVIFASLQTEVPQGCMRPI